MLQALFEEDIPLASAHGGVGASLSLVLDTELVGYNEEELQRKKDEIGRSAMTRFRQLVEHLSPFLVPSSDEDLEMLNSITVTVLRFKLRGFNLSLTLFVTGIQAEDEAVGKMVKQVPSITKSVTSPYALAPVLAGDDSRIVAVVSIEDGLLEELAVPEDAGDVDEAVEVTPSAVNDPVYSRVRGLLASR